MAAGWVTLNIRDSAGTPRPMRMWAEDTVSGPYSFGQVLADGTGAAALAKAEDAAHASGDLGIMALGVRKDTAVALGADGDYHPPLYDSTGKLWVNATVSSGATAGDVANDAADSGNPVKIGSKAIAGQSTVTLVAAADRVENYAGLDGVPLVRPHCGLEDIVTGNATNTDGSSTQCIAAQAAGIKTYLTSIILCNTSATAITVDIKDGASVKVSLPLPAGSGCVFNPPVPIPGTAATAWNFDGSAAATTVTCSMVGFKSKV